MVLEHGNECSKIANLNKYCSDGLKDVKVEKCKEVCVAKKQPRMKREVTKGY